MIEEYTVHLKSKSTKPRKRPKERKPEGRLLSSHVFIPTNLSLFVPICTSHTHKLVRRLQYCTSSFTFRQTRHSFLCWDQVSQP